MYNTVKSDFLSTLNPQFFHLLLDKSIQILISDMFCTTYKSILEYSVTKQTFITQPFLTANYLEYNFLKCI